jgi:hypothetical protein
VEEIKTLLGSYWTWAAIASGAIIGVWWANMTTSRANLTLVIGVAAAGIAVFLLPFVSSHYGPIRLLWGTAACAILAVLVYYTLWDSGPAQKSATSAARPFPVDNIFKDAYQDHKDKLGEPKAEAISLDFVYFGAHEHAHVLWIQKETKFYRLRHEGWTWTSSGDPLPREDTWFSDEDNRKRFNTPSNVLPPWAGVAYQCYINPKDWEWIRWRLWHCAYHETFKQEFEHGFMIGPFRRFREDVEKKVHVFTLLNNQKWESTAVAADVLPMCHDPNDPKYRTEKQLGDEK